MNYMKDSLVVTPKLFRDCFGDPRYADFLAEKLPLGFRLQDWHKLYSLPLSILLEAYHILPITESDRGYVLQRAKISQCTSFYDSHNIENCVNIEESKYCSNSHNISQSSYVEDSENVVGSYDVTRSLRVEKSSEVEESEDVYYSSSVKNSYYVVDSVDIVQSEGVWKCDGAVESHLLYQCYDVRHVWLSSYLEGQEKKILCTEGLGERDRNVPMLFNREVSLRVFTHIRDELKELVDEVLALTPASEMTTLSFTGFQAALNHQFLWNEIKRMVPFYDEEVAFRISCSKFAYA